MLTQSCNTKLNINFTVSNQKEPDEMGWTHGQKKDEILPKRSETVILLHVLAFLSQNQDYHNNEKQEDCRK